ncbi:hypothetical protein [Streptomyces sp.]|uniref:hypothetical protein n=1 Tax=Streptomyces sp. TaxID=1931 RepID=UPI002F3E5A69
MRLTVVSGDRQVDIRIKGHSRKALARAEQAADRLLAAGPGPLKPEPERPFGYAVGADAPHSDQHPGDYHAE